MAIDKNRALSIGRAYDAQALLDHADTVMSHAAQDAAELRKFGWNDARAKSLEESRLAVRNGLGRLGGTYELLSPAFTKRRHTVAAAKLWLRRAVPVAKNVLEGTDDLDAFLKMGDFAAVSQLNRALDEKVAIFKRHSGLLVAEGISPEFVREGERLSSELAALSDIREPQELSKEAEEYAYHKGLLHRGLKFLNRAGQAAFAHDHARKGKYTLGYLNRNADALAKTGKLVEV